MASRFVSGGTNEKPIERDEEWLKAQQDIDAARRENQERGKQAQGQSLYETLQQNKAAKQEAFEESLKLKNQFRPLDEDEVEFLDSVVESERAKDNALREADREQLKRFRQQQEAADRGSESALDPTTDSASSVTRANAAKDRQWAVGGKKRRRRSEKEILRGVNKLRKASSADTDVPTPSSIEEGVETTRPLIQGKDSHSESVKRLDTAEKAAKSSPDITSASTAKPTNPTGLGLGAYDSDSD